MSVYNGCWFVFCDHSAFSLLLIHHIDHFFRAKKGAIFHFSLEKCRPHDSHTSSFSVAAVEKNKKPKNSATRVT